MALKLTMTCGPYYRARALIDGSIKPEDIDLAITVNDDDVERQRQAARGDFDICEFFMGTYIADLPLKKSASPPFRSSSSACSVTHTFTSTLDAGIRKPSRSQRQARRRADLDHQRGAVGEGHAGGGSRRRSRFNRMGGMAAGAHCRSGKHRNGSSFVLRRQAADQFELLARGEIDAGITTEIWAPNRHPDIDFLFPDYAARERDYFRRTRCFPIMHVLLIRDAMLRQNPWVARSLFDAWEASKQKLYVWQEWQRIHMTSLWYRALWEEERAIAGDDIYPMGLRQDPPRGRCDAALRPSPGRDAATLPAAGFVLAVDA